MHRSLAPVLPRNVHLAEQDTVRTVAGMLRRLSCRTSHRTSRRHARAFTLVELVVAMGVTSVIFFALVTWVSSLMRISATSVDVAAVARDRAAVIGLLSTDLLAARPCDGATLEPLWDHVTPASIGFFADVVDASGVPGHDGITDAIVWRVTDDRLERGVAVGNGTCPNEPTLVFATVAVAVSQASTGDPYFTGFASGVSAPSVADCTDPATRCVFDRIDLALQAAQGDADAVPAEILTSFVVSLDAQRV